MDAIDDVLQRGDGEERVSGAAATSPGTAPAQPPRRRGVGEDARGSIDLAGGRGEAAAAWPRGDGGRRGGGGGLGLGPPAGGAETGSGGMVGARVAARGRRRSGRRGGGAPSPGGGGG